MHSKGLVIFSRNYPTMTEFNKRSAKSNIVELSRSPAQKPEANNSDFNEYFLKEALDFSFLLTKLWDFLKLVYGDTKKSLTRKVETMGK